MDNGYVLPDAGEEPPALAGAVALIETATDLDQLIRAFRAHVRAIVGADGVTFVIRHGDSVSYVAEDAVGPLWQGLSFPIRTCISGHAMIDRATIVVPDITVDPRIPQLAYRPTFVRSLVVTPIGGKDPHAVFGAYWAETGMPSEATISAIETLAAAAGRAIAAMRRPMGSSAS